MGNDDWRRRKGFVQQWQRQRRVQSVVSVVSLLLLLLLRPSCMVEAQSTSNSCVFLFLKVSNSSQLPTYNSSSSSSNDDLPSCPSGDYDPLTWPLQGCILPCPSQGCMAASFVNAVAQESVLYMGCASHDVNNSVNNNHVLQDGQITYEGLGSVETCVQFEEWWSNCNGGGATGAARVCGECLDHSNCIPSEITASQEPPGDNDDDDDLVHVVTSAPNTSLRPTASATARNEQEAQQQQPESNGGGGTTILIIVVIVIAAVVCNLGMGFGLWYYVNKGNRTTNSTGQEDDAECSESPNHRDNNNHAASIGSEQPLRPTFNDSSKRANNKKTKNKTLHKQVSLPNQTSQETLSNNHFDGEDDQVADGRSDIEQQAYQAALESAIQPPPPPPQPQPSVPKGFLVAPGASASWAGAPCIPASLHSCSIPSEVLLFEQGHRQGHRNTCPIQHLDIHRASSCGGSVASGGTSVAAPTIKTAPAHPGAPAKARWASLATDQASKPQLSLPFWRQQQEDEAARYHKNGSSTIGVCTMGSSASVGSVPFWRQTAMDKSKMKPFPPAPPSTAPSTNYKTSASTASWTIREVLDGE